MEMVERLERKGLGEVADTAPSQLRAGGSGAGQTIDGGSRVVRNTVRACFCFVGHMKTGWTRLDPMGSRSIFSRDSARVRGGYAQPDLVVIVVHFGPHLRAAASVAHDRQRSGE